MLTTTLQFGPQDHGLAVSDEELGLAEYRLGYDYEVIFGRLYVSPAPNPEHDVVEKHIYNQIFLYSLDHADIVGYVTDRARVFVVSEEKTTAPEPDLAVYVDGPDDDWRTVGPFIVGEVLRGEDIDKDLFRNVDLYWRVPSIQEYWVFDIRENPRRPTLLVHRRARSGWETLEFAASDTYQTPLLPGLKLVISPPARSTLKRARKRRT
jgi:Uma2 family endonuclease